MRHCLTRWSVGPLRWRSSHSLLVPVGLALRPINVFLIGPLVGAWLGQPACFDSSGRALWRHSDLFFHQQRRLVFLCEAIAARDRFLNTHNVMLMLLLVTLLLVPIRQCLFVAVSVSSSPWTGRTVLRPILVPVFWAAPLLYRPVLLFPPATVLVTQPPTKRRPKPPHTEKQTPRGRLLRNATMEIAAERQAVLDSSSYLGTIARSGDSKNDDDDDDEGLENCRCTTGSPEEISPPRGEVSRVGRY
jgi:hypothetical protein